MLQIYPKKSTQMWCDTCDDVLVDSDDIETGCFYLIGGTGYNQNTGEYDGEYATVMFSICSNCIDKK